MMARFTVNFLIATVVILGAFHATPSWQVFALAAAGLAWLSYRGCLAAAREYGEMMIAAVDLFRFQLLAQMRIGLPETLPTAATADSTDMPSPPFPKPASAELRGIVKEIAARFSGEEGLAAVSFALRLAWAAGWREG